MPPLVQLQKLPGKGDGGWKQSVFASFFWLTRDHEIVAKKMHFRTSYSMGNKLLLVARHILSTLTPVSPVIFATATQVAFVLLRNSRFNFHCYTKHKVTPTQKSAQKWRCNLSWLLARKITKGIQSSKPASLNRPITLFSLSCSSRLTVLACDSTWVSSFL